ncbi:MAG: phosphatase PAP2 family protein [Deltaproteobacteria bacterium]|nr:phosphatase PAP2 family protein [Deltaproteobacteria bacterium]TLN03389.1 MAG: phosphatase PAP2 family protein [bacterium]
MRSVLAIILVLSCLTSQAFAEEQPISFGTEVQEGFVRLGNESLEVVTAPVDTENYGPLVTLAVAGGVALTYVFDEDIRNKLHGAGSGTLNTLADVGSGIGNPFVHLGLAAAVYGGGRLASSAEWQETGMMLGEAVVLADATSFILKQTIGRGRPFASNDKGSFRPLQFKSDYDSLPSMHTASSFALASVMASKTDNLAGKALYYLGATFVGFSRIQKDKHWASDIILGAAIGELCGRVVTNYHAGKNRVAIAPLVSGDSALLALVGRW